MHCKSHATIHSHCLRLVTSPRQAVEDETQDKDDHANAQQRVLYCLQHVNTGHELLLEHVCRFIVQHSSLDAQKEE